MLIVALLVLCLCLGTIRTLSRRVAVLSRDRATAHRLCLAYRLEAEFCSELMREAEVVITRMSLEREAAEDRIDYLTAAVARLNPDPKRARRLSRTAQLQNPRLVDLVGADLPPKRYPGDEIDQIARMAHLSGAR